MKILGIDPGLETIGFAILNNGVLGKYGVIKTSSKLSLPNRLLEIQGDMDALIAEFNPDVAGVEELFFGKNVTTGIPVSHARGVIVCSLASAGVPILEVKPMTVKIAICGQGNAPKDQVQRAVQQVFGLAEIPKPDDAADAIAIAYWASQQKHLFVAQ